MYCPKCGGPLRISADGSLECTRGGMQLSKHHEQMLKEVYELDLRFLQKNKRLIKKAAAGFVRNAGYD